MPKTGTLVAVIIFIVLAFVAWEWRYSPIFSRLFGSTTEGQLIAQAHYVCNGGSSIDASYYGGAAQPQPAAGQPPTPTGSIELTLSDGRAMTLAQTISADGARYANKDESFVFWNKGHGALVLENNQEKSYIGCIEVVADPGGLPQAYESGSNGFSLRYPANYKVDDTYVYQNLGPGKDISGVKFTIDPAIAAGTNLGSDTYVSVEQIASTSVCTADKFLDQATASNWDDGQNQYSYATSSGAGAGNRYDEEVFALPNTNPCIAIRYYIHYGAIQNYPEASVKEFDRQQLVNQFDAIRKTLVIVQ